MKPIHHIVIVNDGGLPTGPATSARLAKIAAVIQRQVREHFAPHYGKPNVSVSTGPAPAPGDPSVPVYVRASSDVPGAAGYHDDEGVFVFTDGLAPGDVGPFTLPVVLSHEILEALGDPAANLWADDENGTEYARELCDAVESFSYEIDGVSVSDFVFPCFFDPTGAAPYSYLGAPSAPLSTAAANGADYQIVRTVDENGIQQVTADLSRHPRAKSKAAPTSRTSRRGVVVPKNEP